MILYLGHSVYCELNATLWSKIASALSKPSWKALSTLTIVICAQIYRLVTALVQTLYIKKIEDVMATLKGAHSVDVSVTLKYSGLECDSKPEEWYSGHSSRQIAPLVPLFSMVGSPESF